MPEASENTPDGRSLEMRLSVPAHGDLRGIAGELAAKVAGHLGAAATDAESLGREVEGLASSLGAEDAGAEPAITFDFRREENELVIEARRTSGASEVRHPLPA
jgi:hypothetical protein